LKKNVRRVYGRKHSNGLQAQTPVDKVKNIKIETLSGAKVKKIAASAFISNDTDQDSDAPTSDYIDQAEQMVTKTNNLQMLQGGGPWPSSLGVYQTSITAGETVYLHADTIWTGTTASSSVPAYDGSEAFQGVLRIHGIQFANNDASTGGVITNCFIGLAGGGDDQNASASNVFFLCPSAQAVGTQSFFNIDLSALSDAYYMGKETHMSVTVSSAIALKLAIVYSVYSYGGSVP
jgi:hypothetical protein